MLKRILKLAAISIFLLLTALIISIYYFIQSAVPDYKGKQQLAGLNAKVEVIFDKHGVPHIFAENEEDAYQSLGFIVASERFFQLTLIKRLASGRLSEILGEDLLESDIFFRTIGLNQYAAWSAEVFDKEAEPNLKKATYAYIKGINEFVKNGAKPFEFRVLGIEAEEFVLEDIFLVVGYMALGFAEGMKTDPLTELMRLKTDSNMMADLALSWPKDFQTIPIDKAKTGITALQSHLNKVFEVMPVAPWIGSNAWVISGNKTASGEVLFCNDTHMGFSLPAVWYEAHLNYPGTNLYGNYIAGLPFALVGHTDFCATGLTMFENDDLDFYYEKIEGDRVRYRNEWVELKKREEIIKIKGKNDYVLEVKVTPRGPLMNAANREFEKFAAPISMYWTLFDFPAKSLEATYSLNHAKSLDDAKKGAAFIHAPGLNVMYGDRDGNIAWWASAKLVRRPEHVNSKYFLNGFSGLDEPLGYYDFDENPHSVNPESNFVYSANNQPESFDGKFYPGYYVPDNRARRIVDLLSNGEKFSMDDMNEMVMDTYSPESVTMLQLLLSELESESRKKHEDVINLLENWDGKYERTSSAPLLYNHWIWNTLKLSMSDELGDTLFYQFMNTHFMKTSVSKFLMNEDSNWWDDINTEVNESRKSVINASFNQAIHELEARLGKEPRNWQWGKVHKLELKHPLGAVKPLNLLFNLGPIEISGGNEVLNNQGFHLNSELNYKVVFGPAMRRIIDFSALEQTISVLPGGQSGHLGSRFYGDQFKMYVNGSFRLQEFSPENIRSSYSQKLVLYP